MEQKLTITDKILAATVLRLFPKRVTPNQITIFRFFSIPFVALLLFLRDYKLGLILFAISAFTDALDGAMARTRNQVTEWGAAHDPLADKLLIGISLIAVAPRYVGIELIFSIIFIEMLLIGFAYYSRNFTNRRISANFWGKSKMIFQSIGVGLIILFIVSSLPIVLILAKIVLSISLVLGIISLITYGI